MKRIFFVIIVCAIAILLPVYLLSNDPSEKKTGSTKESEESQQTSEDNIGEDQIMEAQNFREIVGVVTEMTTEGSKQTFRIESTEEEFDIVITPETMIVNNLGETTSIKEGQQFTAYVDINKPMIMIYPPQYAPPVIIIDSGEQGLYKQSQFNSDYVSEKLQFQLTINETTEIIDLAGNMVNEEDIIDQDIIVFYKQSTRSIPEKASIEKIILLTTN